MTELGHVVFFVRDLAASMRFYTEAVGLDLKGRLFDGRGAIFSGGRTHHELLLLQVGEASGPLRGRRIGLYHVGWKVGDDLQTLAKVRDRVLEAGYAISAMSDHTVSQSLYLADPDGNEVELYVDDPAVDWRADSEWLREPVKALALD
jgi:catechol 2,3-dioxygenase